MFPIFIPVLHQHTLRQIKEKYHIVLNIIECKLGMKRLLILITHSYTFCLDGLTKNQPNFYQSFLFFYMTFILWQSQTKRVTPPPYTVRGLWFYLPTVLTTFIPQSTTEKPPNFIDQIGWDKSFITIDIFDIHINH